jgi:hypothetical protein
LSGAAPRIVSVLNVSDSSRGPAYSSCRRLVITGHRRCAELGRTAIPAPNWTMPHNGTSVTVSAGASVACFGTLGREQNAGTAAVFEIPDGGSLCPRHCPNG